MDRIGSFSIDALLAVDRNNSSRSSTQQHPTVNHSIHATGSSPNNSKYPEDNTDIIENGRQSLIGDDIDSDRDSREYIFNCPVDGEENSASSFCSTNLSVDHDRASTRSAHTPRTLSRDTRTYLGIPEVTGEPRNHNTASATTSHDFRYRSEEGGVFEGGVYEGGVYGDTNYRNFMYDDRNDKIIGKPPSQIPYMTDRGKSVYQRRYSDMLMLQRRSKLGVPIDNNDSVVQGAVKHDPAVQLERMFERYARQYHNASINGTYDYLKGLPNHHNQQQQQQQQQKHVIQNADHMIRLINQSALLNNQHLDGVRMTGPTTGWVPQDWRSAFHLTAASRMHRGGQFEERQGDADSRTLLPAGFVGRTDVMMPRFIDYAQRKFFNL